MKKKLFSQKPKKNEAEKAEAVQSPHKKHPFLLKVLGWVVFLIMLSLGCFLLYPELATPQASLAESNIIKPIKMPEQRTLASNVKPVEIIQAQIVQTSPDKEAGTVTEETIVVPAPVINPQNTRPEQAQQPVAESAITAPTTPERPKPVFAQVHSEKQLSAPQYTILHALAFKNAVLGHKNCRGYVEDLLHLENPTEIMKKVVKAFLPYCLHQDEDRDDINIFLAHKKQAILAIFQQKHSTITAYFYALPWLVMDIHKIQPTTNAPMDVLDRLHTAILENNTQDALIELDKLPPRIGAIFNDVRQQLLEQQQRLTILDELIVSLVNKGE
ncbi:MAG: hypothetical protein J6Y85_02990 [Alphaproteobacteria bacterium]|nr:hypothetical protein [Alphaproteobacteria bacterium]